MYFTRDVYWKAHNKKKIPATRHKVRAQLDGDLYRLWEYAWDAKTGDAHIPVIRKTFNWTTSKMSRILTALCNEGWAYRVFTPAFKTEKGFNKYWILPFGEQLPEELRNKKEWAWDELPKEINLKATFAPGAEFEDYEELPAPDLGTPSKMKGYQESTSELSPGVPPQKWETLPDPPLQKCNTTLYYIGATEETDSVRENDHPDLESLDLVSRYEKLDRMGESAISRLFRQEPLTRYLSKLGYLDNLDLETSAELSRWIFNYKNLNHLFWDLRFLSCAVDLNILEIPLTESPGQLRNLAGRVTSEIKSLKHEAQVTVTTHDPEYLKRLSLNDRKKIEKIIETTARITEKDIATCNSGRDWEPGFQIMPWLAVRWEKEKDAFSLESDEAAMAITEAFSNEYWCNWFLTPNRGAACEAMLGMTQKELGNVILEQQTNDMETLNTINKWMTKTNSFQQQENSPVPTFPRE